MTARFLTVREVFCFAAIGAIVGGGLVLGAQDPPNLISNGGFEIRGTVENEPESWNATRPARMAKFVSLDWDREIFRSGHASVSLSVETDHPDEQVYYNWNQAPVPCNPGSSYVVSAWVKAQNLASSAFVVVQCWDRDMKKVLGSANSEESFPVVGTTDWTQVQAAFTVPADTWRVVVLLGLPGHLNPGGKAWFDDIKVVPVSAE